jgi:Sir2 family
MASKKRQQSSFSPVASKRKRIQALHEPPFELYRDPSSPSTDEGLESIINLLHGKKNIAVLLGAGISVSCGIPDFRTKGSGLYSTLDTQVRYYYDRRLKK